jgi:hypothetical protein
LIAVFLVLSAFTSAYYVRTYQGLMSRNSMDIAQIARNITEHRGFTTRFVRPLNTSFPHMSFDGRQLPEINHAPLLPYSLSLLFKHRAIAGQPAIWLTMCFALLAAIAVYLLGNLLFDWRVGLLSMTVFALSPPVLKAAVSGEEWTLAAFFFSLLALVVVLHHRSIESARQFRLAAFPIACAALVSALYMTNHILIFIAVPTAVYFWVTGPYRRLDSALFLAALVLTAAPWAIRNGMVSGIPVLGATGWDILARTNSYPGDILYRTAAGIDLSLRHLLMLPTDHFVDLARKLTIGIGDVGGQMAGILGWVALPFALVSILYRFRNADTNAMRGWMYGVLAIMSVCIALYSVDGMATVMFAPVVAVLASAYFLLLLDARKLHQFFARLLVAGLIFFTVYPSMVTAAWRSVPPLQESAIASARLFTTPVVNVRAATALIYTDAPWELAWRTLGTGVWLPRTDQDVASLEQASVPMNLVILTPQANNLPENEIWYVLHKTRLWREYLRSPEDALSGFMAASRMTKSGIRFALSAELSRSLQESGVAIGIPADEQARLTDPERFLDTLFRNARYPLSESLVGFLTVNENLLGPDYVQILVRGVPK